MKIILDETTEPVLIDNSDDDGLDHYYCCDPDKALCGSDLSEASERDFPDAAPSTCIVCSDLQDKSCEVCGC